MSPRDRERRFRYIREIGCICCRRYGYYAAPEVHHQNFGAHAGGKRLGDEYTVGLCRWHHRGVEKPPCRVGPSLAKEPRRFREIFGTDEALLAEQNELISERERLLVA